MIKIDRFPIVYIIFQDFSDNKYEKEVEGKFGTEGVELGVESSNTSILKTKMK